MANNLATELAREILESLKKEFKNQHLTGNLLNNVSVIETKDYVEIHIKAPSYDFYEYFINGVVVPPKKAGVPTEYASLLDTQGSEYTLYWREPAKSGRGKTLPGRGNIKKKEMRPHNHKGYVNKVLSEGISNWTGKQNLDIKLEQ